MSNSKTRSRKSRLQIYRAASKKARANGLRMQRMREEYFRIEREKEERSRDLAARIAAGSY